MEVAEGGAGPSLLMLRAAGGGDDGGGASMGVFEPPTHPSMFARDASSLESIERLPLESQIWQ